MRQERMRQSSNVEDRRGVKPGVAVGGGIGTIVIILIVVLLGGNPQQLLQQAGQGGGTGGGVTMPGGATTPEQDAAAQFVSRVLGDTEDVWTELFRRQGIRYEPPTLVLFTGQVQSGCGFANSQVGPFYCPADRKIYIDLDFFSELSDRFGAPGDFAQAYVIAHEVGHHVQNLLGTSGKVHQMKQQVDETRGNMLSVRLELQADYYAGVWAHHAQKTRQVLESGDIEEGLGAATAIGDDRLQMQAQGYVVPDSFTHGSSEQRVRWFTRGFKSGDMLAGDTFSPDDP